MDFAVFPETKCQGLFHHSKDNAPQFPTGHSFTHDRDCIWLISYLSIRTILSLMVSLLVSLK